MEYYSAIKKNEIHVTSLAVQWLRFHASNARGMGLIPDQGARIPHARQRGQENIKKKKNSAIYSNVDGPREYYA